MTDKKLFFRKIDIIRMPGFRPPGFSVENLNPEINIIYGPNATGKTTLFKAFSYLMWPKKLAGEYVTLQGDFNINQSQWYVEIDSGRIMYQENGSSTAPPPFPPVAHKNRYYIALHDLLQQDTNDCSLAESIIREAMGGYNITDAVSQLDLKEKPSRKGKTTRKTQNDINNYRQALKKQEQLQEEEQKLKRLNHQLNQIKAASQKLEVVKQALEYSKADLEFKETRAKFKKFPEAMSEVDGNEAAKINEIKSNIKEYKNSIDTEENKLKQAEKILDEIELPAQGITDKFLTELKQKRDQLKSLKEKILTNEDNLKEAETRQKEERKSFIDFIEEEDKLKEVDALGYDELNSFARKAEKLHQKISSFESIKNLLKPGQKLPEDEKQIQRGIQLLEEWLQTHADLSEMKWNRTRNI